MNETQVTYPGYHSAYGSTAQWSRPAPGPYVAISYTTPDDEGMCVRRETFHRTQGDAMAVAMSGHAEYRT